jgi:hypothetical protein
MSKSVLQPAALNNTRPPLAGAVIVNDGGAQDLDGLLPAMLFRGWLDLAPSTHVLLDDRSWMDRLVHAIGYRANVEATVADVLDGSAYVWNSDYVRGAYWGAAMVANNQGHIQWGSGVIVYPDKTTGALWALNYGITREQFFLHIWCGPLLTGPTHVGTSLPP